MRILLKYIGLFFLLMIMTSTAMSQSNHSSQSKKAQKKAAIREKEDLARHYYRNQEYQKTIAVLDKIYWNNPTHTNYIYFSYSLFSVADYETAEKVVKHQIRKFPEQSRYLVDLGYVYRNANNTKKAEKIFDKIIKELPRKDYEIKTVANAFKSRRENDYALKAYLQGRKLFNNQSMFGIEIGQLYDRMGKYDRMFEEYLNLLASDSKQLQTVKYRLQNSLRKDPDNEKSAFFRTALLKKVQKNPDERIFSDLLLWLAIQNRDYPMALIQSKAMERRFNLEGTLIMEIGDIAMNNKAYDIADEAFSFALKSAPKTAAFYSHILVNKLRAQFLDLTHQKYPERKDLEQLETAYLTILQENGRNKTTFPLIQDLANLQAFYLQKNADAIAILQEAIAMPLIDDLSIAKAKIELAKVLLFADDYWEATLLLSQVEKTFKNEPIGHEAKFQNAMLSFYIGEFEWAKTKFDILRAATSKLIANDAMDMSFMMMENLSKDSIHQAMTQYAKANMFLFQHKYDAAEMLFDSINEQYPTHALSDNILMKRAEIYFNKGEFENADSLYSRVYNNYSTGLLADNALMRNADLNRTFRNNTEKAKTLYKKILTDYPGSIFTHDAREYFRELRGDYGKSEETSGSAFSDR